MMAHLPLVPAQAGVSSGLMSNIYNPVPAVAGISGVY